MGCVCVKDCSRYPKPLDGNNQEDAYISQGNTLLDYVLVPSHNLKLGYSVLTQRGYYPETPHKENQDCYCVGTQIQGNPNVHFFGVFDGHGQFGTECSNFVKDRLIQVLCHDRSFLDDPIKAYNSAFLSINEELHASDIDDTMSGTTAITVLVIGNTLYVANVGDSRATIASRNGDQIVSEDLSHDQTPFRIDECERVKLCGARVLSVDQVEGLKDPNIQTWGDDETECAEPPRLWVQNGLFPGTAFTRSVGDSIAEKIGVVAVPEISVIEIRPHHQFFIIASDGIFEFLSSQIVAEMVTRYPDSRDACAFIAGESCKLWLGNENRTDDITIIIVHIKELVTDSVTIGEGLSSGNNLQAGLLKNEIGNKKRYDICNTPHLLVRFIAKSKFISRRRNNNSRSKPSDL
ncbi:probable protein phosphatase 2C 35 [Impatiens glandulifera]|uniref:probable protein phosphatase 2C 35 n=1 Tax=Impatiens glandulifera TaxID=253017 RepID=UPI001FB08D83|nr:probable protein phosphatase 2C 35 [Impatiens glandulifera]